MEKDLFGFEKAIQIDHLTNEQIEQLLKILNEQNKGLKSLGPQKLSTGLST